MILEIASLVGIYDNEYAGAKDEQFASFANMMNLMLSTNHMCKQTTVFVIISNKQINKRIINHLRRFFYLSFKTKP